MTPEPLLELQPKGARANMVRTLGVYLGFKSKLLWFSRSTPCCLSTWTLGAKDQLGNAKHHQWMTGHMLFRQSPHATITSTRPRQTTGSQKHVATNSTQCLQVAAVLQRKPTQQPRGSPSSPGYYTYLSPSCLELRLTRS